MTAYIKRIIEELLAIPDRQHSPRYVSLSQALVQELNRLNPTDFLPHVRFEFVDNRSAYSWYIANEYYHMDSEINPLLNNLLRVQDSYGGEGSRAVSRTFDFIIDLQLRTIIERDYRELELILFPSEAWKSCVIMCGSILEAILYDQLTSSPDIKARALASTKAPRGKGGIVKDLDNDEWKLHHLINVAVDLNILPESRSNTVDQVLRDYRNFVHPAKEVRAQHPCSEAEGLLSKGALDGICNHLTNK